MVQRGSPVPPWRQIADSIRAQIESGELTAGDRLPTLLELAERWGVAVVTVQKGLAQLKREGLVVGVAGYGLFVASR